MVGNILVEESDQDEKVLRQKIISKMFSTDQMVLYFAGQVGLVLVVALMEGLAAYLAQMAPKDQ